jgi:hypothetical protein
VLEVENSPTRVKLVLVMPALAAQINAERRSLLRCCSAELGNDEVSALLDVIRNCFAESRPVLGRQVEVSEGRGFRVN